MRSLLLLGCVSIGSVGASNGYDRPIIGIMTEPLNIEVAATQGLALPADAVKTTFIAASYVKFAEAGGARVVALHYDAPEAELKEMFKKINGVIFPGGGVDINNVPGNKFRQSSELLYNLALEANDKGDVFPIHGTCLGFQMLAAITGGDDAVCHKQKNGEKCFAAEGTPLPLEFTPAAHSSQLFAGIHPALWAALEKENLTENSHGAGVYPETMSTNKALNEFYDVLSINHDTKGVAFASTMEAKKYPITATQWHPEKNAYEWGIKLGPKAIPHSANAVKVTQFMADAFMANARRNHHAFASEAEAEASLIYNNVAVKDPQGYYSQVYLWKGGHPGRFVERIPSIQNDIVV